MSDPTSGSGGGIAAAGGGLMTIAGAALLGVPLAIVLMVAVILGGADVAHGCGTGSAATIDTATLPDNVAGYGHDQLAIAAVGMNVAAARGLSTQAQIIVVAAGMGESGLRNLGYGDDINGVTNPDGSATCSLGVLQQQWCLGWGTRAQVLDPEYAFGAFLDRLIRVTGWEDLDVSIAINRVQGNSDPHYYAKYEAAAREVVDALAGSTGTGGSCSIGDGDWTAPIALDTPNLMISDFYGSRNASITGYSYLHNGVDFSVPIGTPVGAASAGTITETVMGGGARGNYVTIDHGDGVQSQYLHLSSITATKGQHVNAGDVIAASGNTGRSTGPHLHFTIYTDKAPAPDHSTDPIPVLASHNVDLCALPIWSGHTVASTCTKG